jgi:hypothetical protein
MVNFIDDKVREKLHYFGWDINGIVDKLEETYPDESIEITNASIYFTHFVVNGCEYVIDWDGNIEVLK